MEKVELPDSPRFVQRLPRDLVTQLTHPCVRGVERLAAWQEPRDPDVARALAVEAEEDLRLAGPD